LPAKLTQKHLTGKRLGRKIRLYTNNSDATGRPMTYHRPRVLADALKIAADGARVLAGGTDLFPATKSRALDGPLLDLTAIDALSGITRTDSGWQIGATTRWADVVRADLPPAFQALQQAGREVGSVQIQNAGTIAGNLVNASPAADGVPALLVLEAEVELASAGETRRLPLGEFITGVRQTALRKGEIVTALHIPAGAVRGASAFRKLGARRYLVISIVMAAARLEMAGGRITHAALSVGACSPVAQRLGEAEAALIGADPFSPETWQDALALDIAATLAPIDDIRADAAYRADAARAMLSDAITAAARAGGEA
jgi:CO/xanthine dehydrogenase FAD-binding subunit